jgi:HAD superfamily hydrolase (TIGR01509 family)
MIRALFFDLDGTLWDSESVRFRSWRRVFEMNGADYSLESYATRLGTVGGRDPLDDLEDAIGGPIDRPAIRATRDALTERWLAELRLRPGVEEYVAEAKRLGLALGVVSTDERDYVLESLKRLGLPGVWDVIRTADGDSARAKPSPSLYIEALAELDLTANEAIAIEDSPNGILAAKRAALYCVAVRHQVTAALDLGSADVVVESLIELPLGDVLSHAASKGRTA